MTNLTPYNPHQPAVMLVTALAAHTDITDAEYAAIYARVAQNRSLRNIELALGSAVSYGWWAAYANGKKDLDRDRKNELRRWARANGGPDLPDLPPTPSEAVAAHTHPDAAVYQVGSAPATRAVLVGHDVPAVDLHLNSNCAVISAPISSIPSIADPADPAAAPAHNTPVPACNARYARKLTRAIRTSPSTWQRLSAARHARNLTWDAYLTRAAHVDDLVAALEQVAMYMDIDDDTSEEEWSLAAHVQRALKSVRKGEQDES